MLDCKEILKKQKLRNAEYYDMTDVYDNIYKESSKGKVFTNLMETIESENNILLAYRNIKKNSGSKTKGVDGKTIEDIENWTTDYLVYKVRKKLENYKPKAVRRVEIPKEGNNKTRPLGIPCIIDRIIQQCILQVLEPICEAKFHERSNGFRPNRSTEHAIAQSYKMIQGYKLNYVVDIDIKGFFDNVNHKKLRRQLWTIGIRDKKLLCIINEMLKAPVIMQNGLKRYPRKGTPQGGILSPLLSNVVLNELDWWVSNQWETLKTKNEYSCGGPKNRALKTTKLKEMYIVRYADDFKIFCRSRNDAEKIFKATKQWLKERLHLDISKEKSKVINLRTKYSEFLGFKMKATKKGDKWVVKSYMSDNAIKKAENKLISKIKRIQKAGEEGRAKYELDHYNLVVWGIHNYYQYATHISKNSSDIAFKVNRVWNNRFKRRLSKQGQLKPGYLKDKYGKSSQIRYLDGFPITPIGYIQTKNPMYKKKVINKYTAEGRKEVHKSLGIDLKVIKEYMKKRKSNEKAEFSDNRISLYCAQKGRCYVTGLPLELDTLDCHHKKPRKLGGTDEYKNLVLVHVTIHKLIHAVKQETISKYSSILELNKAMIKKVNALRKKCNLEPIAQ